MTDSPPFDQTMMTAMVFYDLDHRPTLTEARDFILRVSAILDEQPTHAHLGNAYGKGERRPQFSRLDKAFDTGLFDDYVYLLGVSYFERKNLSDLSLQVGYYGIKARAIHICFRKDRPAPADLSLIAAEVQRSFNPDFAAARHGLQKDAPLGFAHDAQSVMFQFEHSAGQNGQGKRLKDGFFRDVYPWHYLTPAHLDKRIEGLRFADWVAGTTGPWPNLSRPKGRLTPLGEAALWEVEAADIPEVRARMLEAGLLMVPR